MNGNIKFLVCAIFIIATLGLAINDLPLSELVKTPEGVTL
jgi:hypothetical protein